MGKKVILLKTKKSIRAFSLIELAIAMALLGLFFASSLQVYQVKRQELVKNQVDANFRAIYNALGKYVALNGRYPRPMPQLYTRADAGYGLEKATPFAAGDCTGIGLCRGTGGDDTIDADTDADEVLVGGVPFKTLGLAESQSLDGYGRRFTYAVSEEMTVAGNTSSSYGAVLVKAMGFSAGSGTPFLSTPSESIPHVIVSHGKDGIGAYTLEGKLARACGSVMTSQDENCNNDGIFIRTRDGQVSSDTSIYKNDDLIETDIWSDNNYWAIQAEGIYNRYIQQVGIGRNNPTEMLDVVGNIKTTTARASQICTNKTKGSGDRYCFQADQIGGSGMNCGGGLMIGIQNNMAVCAQVEIPTSEIYRVPCPYGQFMTGIGATGIISCATP